MSRRPPPPHPRTLAVRPALAVLLLQCRRALAATPAALAVLAVAGLAACGVGGEGTGGTAMVASGRVEGFGSVMVAGQKLDESEATLSIEIDPRRPQARPLGDLRLGHTARITAEGTRARHIAVAAEVRGPVLAIDAAGRRLVVAGQEVQFDAVPADATLLEGLSTLADLDLGDWIEVHGQRDAAGVVRAAFVARVDPALGWRVAGPVQAVDAARRTLAIGSLSVDTATAERVGGVAEPAPGERWIVHGTAAAAVTPAPHAWPATALRRDAPPAAADGTAVRVEGLVQAWQPPSALRVRDTDIDLGGIDVPESTRAALVPGRLVRIAGLQRGARVSATSLTIVADEAPLAADVQAAVADFVDPGRFTLRGARVDAALARFEALGQANLANGVPLRVRGVVRAGRLEAQQVAPAEVPAGSAFVQSGSVAQFEAGGGTLRLAGLATPLRLAAQVRVLGGTLADLAVGRAVVVRGTLQGGEFVVAQLQFQGTEPLELAGIAGNVEADAAPGSGGAFEIGPTDIVWTADTRFIGTTGTAADLSDGHVVRVRAVREGNVVRALEIDTRATQPGLVRLRGTVTRYVSPAEFSIEGQRIDARAAVFEPAALRDTLPAAFVDVEGEMVDGVLRATRVSDP